METKEVINVLSALEIQIGTLIIGWFGIILGLVIKDMLTSFTFGFLFYLNPQFTEGDVVYIDGDEATIQKIGLTTSVFKIKETGNWRFIKNEKIRYHKLEKKFE